MELQYFFLKALKIAAKLKTTMTSEKQKEKQKRTKSDVRGVQLRVVSLPFTTHFIFLL
jgi:hypothetical protein